MASKRQTIEDWLERGELINAIKAYREVSGCGLKESKEAVDYYRANGRWRDADRMRIELQGQAPAAVSLDPDASKERQQIESLVRAGQKIAAIKAFREVTGVGLKEAKDAVERFTGSGAWESRYLGCLSPPEGRSREGLEPTPPEPEGADLQHILSLLAGIEQRARSSRIHAIKDLRDLAPFGLKDAKEAVEHFCDRGTWRDRDLAFIAAEVQALSATGAPEPDLRSEEQRAVEELVLQDRKIQAIKRFREARNVSLTVAKDAVEDYMARDAWPAGCWDAATEPIGAAQSQPPELPAVHEPDDTVPNPPARTAKVRFVGAAPVSTATQTALAAVVTEPIEGIVPAKRIIDEGHLCLLQTQIVFVAEAYGDLRVEYAVPYAEVTSAEVRQSFGRPELILKKGYSSEYFSEIAEEDARAVADFVMRRAKAP